MKRNRIAHGIAIALAALISVASGATAASASAPATQLNVSRTLSECKSTRAFYISAGESVGSCFPLKNIVKIDSNGAWWYKKGYRYAFYASW